MSAVLAHEQLYAGGAASDVVCCSCGATTTSGSWRKGWPIEGTDHWANLCNRYAEMLKHHKRYSYYPVSRVFTFYG